MCYITIYIYIRYLKICPAEKIFIIGYIMENTLYTIQNLVKQCDKKYKIRQE